MLESGTVPSRWMRKETSARNALRVDGEKRSAIWRTMFSRYPGYGNSIPPVLTVATSVPRPPVSPPPAVGVGAFVSVFVSVGRLGVASGVFAVGAVLVGAGMSRGAVFGRTGGGSVVGVGAGCGLTTPAARSPGGAATRSTRYSGGDGGAAPGRAI